jgi:hypothetical protein
LDDSSRLTPHANKSGRRSEDDGEEEKIGKKRKKRRLGSADVVAATILRAFRAHHGVFCLRRSSSKGVRSRFLLLLI